MAYKFNPVQWSRTYSEIEQNNPLRWQFLFREGDTFTPQTSKFKCKDFLNDVVAWYQGKKLDIYGMRFGGYKFNEDGVWLRLYEVSSPEVFTSNIENTINVFFSDVPERQIYVEDLGEKSMLMFVPKHFFESTYLISLASFLIRLSNYEVEI